MDDTTLAAGNAAKLADGTAQVRTADHVTRYTRLGAGRPVLVLDLLPFGAALWPDLLDRLADGNRVILPEVPRLEARFTSWLRGFVDGMGLPPVTLIAVGDLCVPSIEFTLLEPERVNRLVLVPSGGVEETGLAGVLTSTLSSADVEMLVIRRDYPTAEAIDVVERFLRGERS